MNVKHGGRQTALYHIWCAMKSRCSNPNNAAYANYGGRGILVCEAWSASFSNFRRDMGERPPGGMLERVDNDRGYEPGNCVWATRTEQNRNRRNVRMLSAEGRTQSMAAWAEQSGIPLKTISRRLLKGWSEQDAVTIPVIRARAGVPRGSKFHGAERGVEWSEQEATA